MSLADDYRSDYREMIVDAGETITLRRVGTPNVDVSVRARVTGYRPEELVGGINQGDRRVIVLAEDVESTGFPVPFKTGGTDKVLLRGRVLNIAVVDDSTRRVAGELIAYEIKAVG